MSGLESSVAAHHVGVTRCRLTLEVALETAEKSAWFSSPHVPPFLYSPHICNTFKNRIYFCVEFKPVYSV